MYVKTGLSGYRRGLGAYSGALSISGPPGMQTISWTDIGGIKRTFPIPPVDQFGAAANWILTGSDPNANLQNQNNGETYSFGDEMGTAILNGITTDASGNVLPYLPPGYGNQGYFSDAGAFACGPGTSLQRPPQMATWSCIQDTNTPASAAYGQSAYSAAGQATGCNASGSWIPELQVGDCDPGQTWKQQFYKKLMAFPAGNIAILNPPPVNSTVNFNGKVFTPAIPQMMALSPGQQAPAGAIVVDTTQPQYQVNGVSPGRAVPSNDAAAQAAAVNADYLLGQFNQANIAYAPSPATSTAPNPTPQFTTQAGGGVIPNSYAAPTPPITASQSTQTAAATVPATAQQTPTQSAPASFLASLFPQTAPAPASAAPAGGSAPAPAAPSGSFLDGITSWIGANPIVTAVGAVGILFLFSQGGKR